MEHLGESVTVLLKTLTFAILYFVSLTEKCLTKKIVLHNAVQKKQTFFLSLSLSYMGAKTVTFSQFLLPAPQRIWSETAVYIYSIPAYSNTATRHAFNSELRLLTTSFVHNSMRVFFSSVSLEVDLHDSFDLSKLIGVCSGAPLPHRVSPAKQYPSSPQKRNHLLTQIGM